MVIYVYVITLQLVAQVGKEPQSKKMPRGDSMSLPENSSPPLFSVATLFRFVARFARVRIEDSNRNRFALNSIQKYFFGRIFYGRILSGYQHHRLTDKDRRLTRQHTNRSATQITFFILTSTQLWVFFSYLYGI